jgi:3-oxoacyl-[acyl-carrier protein] reductase
MDLTGKVALVTGSSKGIGRAAAVRLGQSGAKVCINARKDVEGARDVERTVRENGSDCFFRQADVTDEDDVKGMVDDVLARWGKIDILVNNAGISGAGPKFFDITGDDWDRMLTANTKGMFLVTKAVLAHMVEARSGKIVNLASTAGTASLVTANAHYTASKGAIVAFTRRMARDFASFGINVNCVAPGLIHDTGFNERMSPEKLAYYVAQIPLGRPGYVKDVSGIIAFLCSEDADFITGQIIVVDGGATC